MNRFYFVVRGLLTGFVRAIFRIEIIGAENEPQTGAHLVCANHMSLWDPVTIGACLKKRQVRFMAKAELFKIPLLGGIIRALGAFPVKRGGSDVRAVKTTIELLKNGECVGIFPQGTRRRGIDPCKTEVKGGAGMCAYHSGCDVLPVAIVNKRRKMIFLQKTFVIIGKPIKYTELQLETNEKPDFKLASKFIFDRVCELSDKYYPRLPQ